MCVAGVCVCLGVLIVVHLLLVFRHWTKTPFWSCHEHFRQQQVVALYEPVTSCSFLLCSSPPCPLQTSPTWGGDERGRCAA